MTLSTSTSGAGRRGWVLSPSWCSARWLTSPRQRTALYLRYFEDLAEAQTAFVDSDQVVLVVLDAPDVAQLHIWLALGGVTGRDRAGAVQFGVELRAQ